MRLMDQKPENNPRPLLECQQVMKDQSRFKTMSLNLTFNLPAVIAMTALDKG